MSGLRIPRYSRPMMMKNPYGSKRAREYWNWPEEKPMRILEPSKGGIGIRLKAASIMLI